MPKLNLKLQLIVYVLSASTLIYLISIFVTSVETRNITRENAKKIVQTQTKEYRNKLQDELNNIMSSARNLKDIFKQHKNYSEEERDKFFRSVLNGWLENNNEFLAVWLYWDYKTFNPDYQLKYGRLRDTYFRLNGKINYVRDTVDMTNEDIETVFYKTRAAKEEDIWDPYYDLHNKELENIMMTSLCAPIVNDGNYEGMVGVDISLEDFKKIIVDITPFEETKSYILSSNKTIIAHTDLSFVGKNFLESGLMEKNTLDSAFTSTDNFSPHSFEYYNAATKHEYLVSYAPIRIGNVTKPWVIGIEVPRKVIMKEADKIFYRTIIMSVIGLVVLYIVVFFIANRITKPILKAVDFAKQIANGNLDASIDINQNNEIGELALSLSDMSVKLQNIIKEIGSSTEIVTRASDQLTSHSKSLADGASNQATSSEEVSASMEEIVASILQNAENSKKTNEIANKSSNGIKTNNELITNSLDSINEIAEKISIVGEIAQQTNILALNAAVEAARAGTYGKGFSVVASEVKKLAEKSQIAAQEINELAINGLQIVKKSKNELSSIIPDIERTSRLIQEISAASIEQKSGTEQVNMAIQQLNSITQKNAATSAQFSESSLRLLEEAEKLKKLISYFKINQ